MIFKDRVEIVSPGGLPAGMTEADLGKKSIPRNLSHIDALIEKLDRFDGVGCGRIARVE